MSPVDFKKWPCRPVKGPSFAIISRIHPDADLVKSVLVVRTHPFLGGLTGGGGGGWGVGGGGVNNNAYKCAQGGRGV